MNTFRETLSKLAHRVEGARAVSIVGLDGIAIDSWPQEQPFSLEEVAAELGAFVKRLESPRTEASSGRVRELAVVYAEGAAILSRITPEYYLLLLLAGAGSLGLGRWEAKKTALALQEELS